MIIPSIESCKRLKEAGWNKPTHFYWDISTGKLEYFSDKEIPSILNDRYLSAPTLEEILSNLPEAAWGLAYGASHKGTGCEFQLDFDDDKRCVTRINPSAVEAACELWILLNKKEEQ